MRKLWTGLLVGALAVLAPAAVFAAAAQPFTASGELTQTSTGTATPLVPLGAVEHAVPPAMFAAVEGALAGFGGAATPGLLTTGQAFTGSFNDSKWGAVKNANVAVAHNSWVTGDFGALCAALDSPPDCTPTAGEVDLVGLAWGSFTLTKGNGNRLTGGYAAVITGYLRLNPACPNFLAVEVTDIGGWGVVPGSTHGAFGQINEAGGGIAVLASGCMGAETALIEVTGTR